MIFQKGLRAKASWKLSELGDTGNALKKVASNWQIIRNEGLDGLFGNHKSYQAEATELHQEGKWQQLVLYENGHQQEDGCKLAPKTCQILDKYLNPNAVSCKRGQIKFSIMHPGTHVRAHTGPTNTRLRAHLGLVVPDQGLVEIRVGNETLRWTEGKVFVIDDSFEHEVWQSGNTIRLVLLIDFWHPDLSESVKQRLQPLPVQGESHNRTTIFHIGGIVDDLINVKNSVVSNKVTY